MKIFSDWKFHIAVKELIIEWEDYQAEFAGYVHCKACEDLIDQSEWFNHNSENSDIEKNSHWKFWHKQFRKSKCFKPTASFCEITGSKNYKYQDSERKSSIFPVNLKQCRVESVIEEEIVVGNSLQVRREHRLNFQIRPRFYMNSQPLLIKHAHITVEIYLQWIQIS